METGLGTCRGSAPHEYQLRSVRRPVKEAPSSAPRAPCVRTMRARGPAQTPGACLSAKSRPGLSWPQCDVLAARRRGRSRRNGGACLPDRAGGGGLDGPLRAKARLFAAAAPRKRLRGRGRPERLAGAERGARAESGRLPRPCFSGVSPRQRSLPPSGSACPHQESNVGCRGHNATS